jgi:hypothetical protein
MQLHIIEPMRVERVSADHVRGGTFTERPPQAYQTHSAPSWISRIRPASPHLDVSAVLVLLQGSSDSPALSLRTQSSRTICGLQSCASR